MKQTCDRLVLGFILISFILGLALASSAFSFDYTSITFGQTSSAKTSAPNVRVAVQYPRVAKDQAGNVVQGFAPNAIYNYYLTKSTTHTFSGNVTSYDSPVGVGGGPSAGDNASLAFNAPLISTSSILTPPRRHGPLNANPESETWEGLLGDVSTPPNTFGVMSVRLENYASLKIPYLPADCPFALYLGDTSEKKEVGKDEEGNPIYETVYAGEIQ